MLDPTATHLPVFKFLFAKYPYIKDVLEFECGLCSTPMFLENGCNVTSIEMQHESWYERVQELCPKADVRLALGPMTWQTQPLKDRYDLIFVDGHGDSRPECMMWAKDHTNIIVAHDTEHPYYCWDRADMTGWEKEECKDFPVWTTYWIRK